MITQLIIENEVRIEEVKMLSEELKEVDIVVNKKLKNKRIVDEIIVIVKIVKKINYIVHINVNTKQMVVSVMVVKLISNIVIVRMINVKRHYVIDLINAEGREVNIVVVIKHIKQIQQLVIVISIKTEERKRIVIEHIKLIKLKVIIHDIGVKLNKHELNTATHVKGNEHN